MGEKLVKKKALGAGWAAQGADCDTGLCVRRLLGCVLGASAPGTPGQASETRRSSGSNPNPEGPWLCTLSAGVGWGGEGGLPGEGVGEGFGEGRDELGTDIQTGLQGAVSRGRLQNRALLQASLQQLGWEAHLGPHHSTQVPTLL